MRYPKASREQLTAPPAKFRVLTVQAEGNSEAASIIADFESLTAAKKVAKENAGVGSPVFIYDDKGELVVRYGSWH